MNTARQLLRLIVLTGLITYSFVASATVLNGKYSTTFNGPNYWLNDQYIANFSYDTSSDLFSLNSLSIGGMSLLKLPGTVSSSTLSPTQDAWTINDNFYVSYPPVNAGYYILQAKPNISYDSSTSTFLYADGFDTWYSPSPIGPWNIYFNFVNTSVPAVGSSPTPLSAPEPSSLPMMLIGLGIIALIASVTDKRRKYKMSKEDNSQA